MAFFLSRHEIGGLFFENPLPVCFPPFASAFRQAMADL